MATTHLYAGHGGAYVKAVTLWVGVGGSWHAVKEQYIGQGGVYRHGYSTTPGPLASVSIAPTSGSVTAGQQIQFTATGHDADGLVVSLSGHTVVWSIDTITDSLSSSGLFTAGSTPDTCDVTVTVDSTYTATATVTVS